MAVRKLYNFLSGALGSGLSESGQVIDFGQVIPVELFETNEDGKEFVPLVISPDTTPEIVHLVDYQPGNTTGIIERGKEGTEPVSHFAGASWGCKPLVEDVSGGGGGGSVAVLDDGITIIEDASGLNFGKGLRASPWRNSVRIDAESANQVITLEAPTVAVSQDGEGNLVITHTSAWGIDANGIPYYDPEGAEGEDIAALVFYPATREYALEWVSLSRTRIIGATVADALTYDADPLQKFMGALHPANLEATVADADIEALDGRFDTDIVWEAEVAEAGELGLTGLVEPSELTINFSQYGTGLTPSDWESRWRAPSASNQMTVQERQDAFGGKVARFESTRAHDAFVYKGVTRSEEFLDVDVTMRMRPFVDNLSTVNYRAGPIVRAGGDSLATRTGVMAFIRGDYFSFTVVNNGSQSTWTEWWFFDDGKPFVDWYWIRLQVIGSEARAKAWRDGDPEPPGWTFEVINSANMPSGPGGIGVYRYSMYDDDVDVIVVNYASPSIAELFDSTLAESQDFGLTGFMQRSNFENFEKYDTDERPQGWIEPWHEFVDLHGSLRGPQNVYDTTSRNHQRITGPNAATMVWSLSPTADWAGVAYRYLNGQLRVHWSAHQGDFLTAAGWELFDNMVEAIVAGKSNPKVVFNHQNPTLTVHEQAFVDRLQSDYSNVVTVQDGGVMAASQDADILIVRAPGTLSQVHPELIQNLPLPIVSMSRHTSRWAFSMLGTLNSTNHQVYHQRPLVWHVHEDGNEKFLRRHRSNHGVTPFTWEYTFRPDGFADVDLLAKVRPGGTGTRAGIVARLTDDGGGVSVNLATTNILRIHRYSGESQITVSSVSFDWSVGQWYWLRLQVEGDQIRAKAWADGEAEPLEWTNESTSTLIPQKGRIGVVANTSIVDDWDFFSIESANPSIEELNETGIAEATNTTISGLVQHGVGVEAQTDFSNYSLGAFPQGWVEPWTEDEELWEVREDAEARGGRLLRVDKPSGGYAIGWDNWGEDSDKIINADLQVRVRVVEGSGLRCGVVARMYPWRTLDTDENMRTGVSAYLSSASLSIRETWFNANRGTNSINIGAVVGEWYWIRLQVEGEVARARAWRDGDPEPREWLLERNLVVEHTIPGYVGVVSMGNAGIDEFDEFIVIDTELGEAE